MRLIAAIPDFSCVILDRARVKLFLLLRPWSGRLAARKEERVAFWATAQMAAAFLLSCLFPLPLIAWGTLALGVPHVLADLRHLVFRTGYARRKGLSLAVGIPVVIAACGGGIAFAGACVMAASWFSKGKLLTRAAFFLLAAAASIAGVFYPRTAALVFVHAHNFVAVIFWWAWRSRRKGWHFVPLFFFAAACAAIVAGAVPLPGVPAVPGFAAIAESLAPGFSPGAAARLVALFAFAQSVHYGAWLKLIPEEDRPRRSAQSFRKSWEGLARDCGPKLVAAAALATAFFCAWGFADLTGARLAYLNVAGFHGYLELAALALFATEGRPRDGLA